MNDRRLQYGVLLLRVALALCFFAHAGFKIFVATPSGASQFFSSLGLPGFLAYLVIAGELISGIALLFGILTPIVAVLSAVFPLGSIIWVHGKAGFYFDNPHGGWEYPAFWIISLIVLALTDSKPHLPKSLS